MTRWEVLWRKYLCLRAVFKAQKPLIRVQTNNNDIYQNYSALNFQSSSVDNQCNTIFIDIFIYSSPGPTDGQGTGNPDTSYLNLESRMLTNTWIRNAMRVLMCCDSIHNTHLRSHLSVHPGSRCVGQKRRVCYR